MTLDELRITLADHKIELSLDGDRLQFRAPVGAYTQELRDAVAQHRQALIGQLRTKPDEKAERCVVCDYRNWVDAAPNNGIIRTTCRVCGRWQGNRPVGV
ncbi:MAG: hypothetical protein AB7O68_20495 [Pirellulales bacterium]